MPSSLLLTLRRLRAPIILLIVVFAAGMVGLVLIPGVDADGQPWRMTLFQAFYFTTYTASTIGFGEIPHAFTDTQRLWVTLIIYASVIGWAYLLANLLSLGRDKAVGRSLAEKRFKRRVQALVEPKMGQRLAAWRVCRRKYKTFCVNSTRLASAPAAYTQHRERCLPGAAGAFEPPRLGQCISPNRKSQGVCCASRAGLQPCLSPGIAHLLRHELARRGSLQLHASRSPIVAHPHGKGATGDPVFTCEARSSPNLSG